jgi:simple sugar transport system ATP-binding protein
MMEDDLAVDSSFGSYQQPSAGSPTVRALNITKYFGAVRALGNACLSLYPGKVLCLVGDNGAGKSTLSKIVCGQLRPDAGDLLVDGVAQPHLTPRRALSLGIAVVPQTLALCDNLTAAQNVMLGCEPTWLRVGPLGFVESRRSRREARARINEIGVNLDSLDVSVRRMSGGERQAIAIARAMVRGRRVIVFDEPTAALGVHQTEATLELVKRVALQGIAVMVISHSLPDVMAVADRIVALRHGETIMDEDTASVREADVADAMGLRTTAR